MTLVEIVNKLKKYAEGQFSNPTVMVGSVYENMNTKELKYPCINIDNVNLIKRENDVVYSFYIYYADRLNEDASNQLEIQSQANTSLQLILHNIFENGAMSLDEYYNAIITPFKLKFVDVTAGAWMQINVHTTNGIDYCDNPSIINTLYITTNGDYDCEDYDRVDVNVPTGITPTGTSEFTDNGTYDVTNDATAIVNIDKQALVDSGFTSGWTAGFQSGETVGFQSGYTSGHTDGYNEGYTSGETDGFQSGYTSGYTDGYQSGYTSGHTDGYAEGQASVPLSSTAFTANDTYTKTEGGWNSVTVNVPSVTTQTLTQAQYDALAVKDPMVIYLING